MKRNMMLFVLLAFTWAGMPVRAGYEIGDTVANFRLRNFDNSVVALSDYKDKRGVILIFDCNTCPYSQAYNDRIIALHQRYGPKGFPVITINANDPGMSPGDSFAEMVKRANRKNYTFPYLIDETQQVARAFGATNTPHVFVLNNQAGNFKVAYIGAIDNNSRSAGAADKKYVEEAVDALLSARAVPTKETRAIGCAIKYRDA